MAEPPGTSADGHGAADGHGHGAGAGTSPPAGDAGSGPPLPGPVLIALVGAQLGVHAAMAGVRMAAPLQALGAGATPWMVGMLLAMFAAAPVVMAMNAGRMADRHGYHLPMRRAAFGTIAGCILAVASTWLPLPWWLALLVPGAMLCGAGANLGMLTGQRTAALAAGNSADRVRIFSWLGVAPSASNAVGPVLAGLLIDHGGFRVAYAAMLALPLLTLWLARRVPAHHSHPPRARAAGVRRQRGWDLLRLPGMAAVLAMNWALSACWDAHGFALPVLGHERGFSATAIGLLLGTFTASVTLVRLAIPLLAHRMQPRHVIRFAMIGTALVFAAYPLAHSAAPMAVLAVLLGLFLGCVQPMIMSRLHQIAPAERQGEVFALRSMAINLSSALLPLLFGALGSTGGISAIFWVMAAVVAGASWLTRERADWPDTGIGAPSAPH